MGKQVKVNKAFVEQFLADNNGYPEVGTFEDKKDLQKFYKHLSDEQLTEWIEVDGLEYTPADSQPIERMRKCMAILYSHFPKQPSAKKKSKYADYTLEALVSLALENEVAYEPCDDERIHRMRAIMALRANDILK
jgi:hypothetical protein